ncbi:MAG: cryptochrome/photolyase family protein [Pirellulales bacterium]|nr:cryptochrome/photolyase family protein [Pirellulales bacterium]MDA7993204.1 cryptochrome/photolyase family protein [Pirellulales bacterium]
MCRNLVLVLGDQLDQSSAAFDNFDKDQDVIWMAEVAEESTHVWTHKARIVLFLSAMRHFRDHLLTKGFAVDYHEISEKKKPREPISLADALKQSLHRFKQKGAKPNRLICVEPGEWRVRLALEEAAKKSGIPLEVRPDRHFFTTVDDFSEHAAGRKQLRLEFFYRPLRERFDVLMDNGEPTGGQWNYDADNRGSFGKSGPEKIKSPKRFKPDAVTRTVIDLVSKRFQKHPGSLEQFDWPVTKKDARAALRDFITYRLSNFGVYQDAIWTGEPWLYHSRLSVALNLKLLDPRDVISAAENAYREGSAPLASVEGFIRQILGWREYVRGVYWRFMPEYAQRNSLGAEQPLPSFYWTGDTEMNCLKDALGQTLEYGYAHHIQRLMVTGLFAMMYGVKPEDIHKWYLAVYVDAVEWVELPNTIGMSQFADGGVMASKPYCATGAYIDRMSNACKACRYKPKVAQGPDACPFTTLYWDFLARHEKLLKKNPRMSMQLRNLGRKDSSELKTIRRQAEKIRTP